MKKEEPSVEAEEIQRLHQATNEIFHSYHAAFQNTPAGKYAAYLLERWREIALKGL